LFGDRRRLFKRVVSYDALRHPSVHRALAGRPYHEAVAITARLATLISRRVGTSIDVDDLLIDAPPTEREVEFRLTVRDSARPGDRDTPASGRPYSWHRFEKLSPVVRSLAHEQFDDLVKRVRLFAPADVAAQIAGCPGLEEMVLKASEQP